MSMLYSVILGCVLAIVWVFYIFGYKKEKITNSRFLNFFAVVFMGPILFYGFEMLYYGTIGNFLFPGTSIELMRETMGLSGLIVIIFGLYFLFKEFVGELIVES